METISLTESLPRLKELFAELHHLVGVSRKFGGRLAPEDLLHAMRLITEVMQLCSDPELAGSPEVVAIEELLDQSRARFALRLMSEVMQLCADPALAESSTGQLEDA